MVGTAFVLLPDTLIPDHIARWERGAWGEQHTAKVLKPLKKEGWVVRQDLATRSGRGNRDHIIAGAAVYLLDSKLLKDEAWLEGEVLHVRRVDDSGDAYSLHHLTPRMRNMARGLERDIDEALGFPVAVYPVVVIWGHFSSVQHAGDVTYVAGEELADWLRSRPADLLDERKWEMVSEWLRSLPLNA
jgi:Nuclease-related domain